MSGIMKKSLLNCLTEDYKQVRERIFDKINVPIYSDFDESELPPLRLRYMIEDYSDDQVATGANPAKIVPISRTN